jgi:PmbA protein
VVRIEGFLGGNANPTSGDFSFGIHGTLLDHGEPARAVSEMNVSGNLFDLLARWAGAADDPWPYGAWRSPSLLFDGVQLSGA